MVNPILNAARAYLAKGWRPIPLSRTKGAGNDRGKHPDVESGWQLPAYYEAVAANPDAYFQANHNIGILLSVSRLADVDLDSPEARLLAEAFLPPTPARFGRRSTPRAHWIYRIAGDLPRTTSYDDPAPREGEKARLVELRCLSSRGTPVQSMFPPSLHVPSGEQVEWESEGVPEPAEVDGESLHAAVRRLAAAALLARRWHEGARHALALCVAGALARAGWAERETAEFILAVATAAGDRELSDRRRAVADTYEAFQKGDAITGLPTLEELLGKPVAERFAEWLSLRRAHGTQESDAKPKREAESLRLAKAALESITELFYGQGTIYVSLKRNGHVETHPLLSKTFENYLAALGNELGIVPRESTLTDAVAYLRGEAAKRDCTRAVHIRVGGDPETAIYLDLCTPDWRVVEVTPKGWRVIPYSDCPVRFIRPRHALPLPTPTRGNIHDLRMFLRASEGDFLLIAAWLLMALRPDAPYPILALRGEQGSGKSTATRLLRDLIDPRMSAHAAPPRTIDDLMVHAAQTYIVAYDNLSRIPLWLSDALCRLATGAGLEKRELYTNAEVVALFARRPVVVNAIREIIERPDLADRTLQVELLTIPESERLPERDLLQAWESVRAGILGALLDGVSYAMRAFRQLQLPELPRMADFALWAAAGVQAWGYTPMDFLNAYRANRAALSEQLTERDLLATAIVSLMDGREVWEGTASDLLSALAETVGDAERAYLPKPNKLRNRLLEIAPLLRPHGIRYTNRRAGKQGSRLHRLEKSPTQSSESSVSSATPDFELNSDASRLTIPADDWTVSSACIVSHPRAELNSESPTADDTDGTDDTLRSFTDHPLAEWRAAHQQAIYQHLQRQGFVIEGDSEQARQTRERLLLQAAADAGYPALVINGRRTGEGAAYWRLHARTLAAHPLEAALCLELFARAKEPSRRRCILCGGRFGSATTLICATCQRRAGKCPYCQSPSTQVFDTETALCHQCRRRFPLSDAERGSLSGWHAHTLAQEMGSLASDGGVGPFE